MELAAVTDVRRRIAGELLVDVLHLRQHARDQEPAATELPAFRTDFINESSQLAVRLVVPRTEEEVVAGKAVDRIGRVLREPTVGRFRVRLAFGALEHAEQLEATELDERID